MPSERVDRTRIDSLGERSAGTEARVDMLNDDVREIFRILAEIKDSGNAADNDQNQRISKLEDRVGSMLERIDKSAAAKRNWAIAIITAVIGGVFAITTTLITLLWSEKEEQPYGPLDFFALPESAAEFESPLQPEQ